MTAALLAHGGTAGAIVEFLLVATVVGVMAAVYLGKRRVPEDEQEREPGGW